MDKESLPKDVSHINAVYAFIDDQVRQTEFGELIILTATVWDQAKLLRARQHWLDAVSRAVNLNPKRIEKFPRIHGSDMDKSLSREQKISIFRAAAETIVEFEGEVFRIGYYVNPLEKLGNGRNIAFSLCMFGIQSLIQSSNECCFYNYILEIDRSNYRAIDRVYNDYQNQYIRHILGNVRFTIPKFENIVGTFYCDKNNHLMYITDLFSYQYKKFEEGATGRYVSEIVDGFREARKRLRFKEYIAMEIG